MAGICGCNVNIAAVPWASSATDDFDVHQPAEIDDYGTQPAL